MGPIRSCPGRWPTSTPTAAASARNLPQGSPPFGHCDMNSADGLTPEQFAAACGITTNGGWPIALTDDEQAELLFKVRQIWDQLGGRTARAGPQLGQKGQR